MVLAPETDPQQYRSNARIRYETDPTFGKRLDDLVTLTLEGLDASELIEIAAREWFLLGEVFFLRSSGEYHILNPDEVEVVSVPFTDPPVAYAFRGVPLPLGEIFHSARKPSPYAVRGLPFAGDIPDLKQLDHIPIAKALWEKRLSVVREQMGALIEWLRQ